MNPYEARLQAMITRGWCLLFVGGPPWNWLPSVQRSGRIPGWSFTWLWWGLHWLPLPPAVVIAGAVSLAATLREEAALASPSKEAK